MKKAGLLLLALVTVVSGCVLSDAGNNGNENGNDSIAGEYLPQKLIGASYTWKLTETDTSTGSRKESTYTIHISDAGTLDGNTFYSAYSDSGKLYNRFSVEDDRLNFRLDGTMYGLNEDGYPYGEPPSVDYCLFDFGTSRDVERSIMDWGSQTDSTYVNYRIKGMYMGPSSTTVPAGAFTDCRQFRITPSITFTPKVTGNTVKIARTEVHWFAKGIGPVRREISCEDNGRSYKTITEVLVSYSLP